ncbi:integrase arm-type DNA-binding domain-containing protein [Sphingomonas sp. CCH16-B10]|uniref:integrase arm-type DNA-binding domain-containing protein n=1 Tax=Sphingomonas sp. CCH16-B10 TaxID=1768755 RepID=UPI0012E3ED7C|nr:integrase arm-type DNA-binding domain-containing protein [Sphingomonas sp. CCH16-B10]
MNETVELTDKIVRGKPPATGGQYLVRDAALPGFFVVVGKRTKTFTVQCDVKDELGRRRTKKVAIGQVGELSVAQARAKAKATLGALQVEGKFEERRKEWTLGEAWEHMRDFELPGKGSRPRTVDGYEKTIRRLMGDWRDVPLRRFADKPYLVTERHRAITNKNGDYAANHFGRAFRRLYNYAQAKLDRTLPVTAWSKVISFNREYRRNTGMGEGELSGWFAQLAALPNGVRREFHLLTLLSGSRPDALSRAEWRHVDVRRRALHIPDPKGGEHRAFDIPLSRPMLASLARARRAGRMLAPRQAERFIFPAAKSKSGHLVEWKEDRTILSKWGVDLRQSYTIAGEALDVSERTMKRLMNHATQDVTMGYGDRNKMWPRLVAEQERLSAHLMAAAGGNPQRGG